MKNRPLTEGEKQRLNLIESAAEEIAGIAKVSYSDWLTEVRYVGQNRYNLNLDCPQVEYSELKYLDAFPLSHNYRFIRLATVMSNGTGLQIHVDVVNREW
jgi:hypothetical protein